jgi:peptidoglycan/xylan/chitin deacetylase (PgdA/CDA1 family)
VTPRTTLVRSVASALGRTGLLVPVSLAAGWVAGRRGFQVLTYHRVNDERDPFFPSVPTDVFERHMAFVARTYCVLTVEDLAERARRDAIPRQALAITFDDGYRDTLTHAAPILARYGLAATVFLTTGLIGGHVMAWFDRLALGFKTARVGAVVAPWGERLVLGSPAAQLQALERALGYFKRVPDHDRERGLESLLGGLDGGDPASVKNPMLTWDDVHALEGLGVSIGAHTVSHPVLSRVSPERAWAEIRGSRDMIQSVCGRAPRAFAYPNGQPADYTETVQRLVREAGFACAVTTRFGLNRRETPPYELRRGGPWEHDLATFAVKLVAHRLAAG